MSRIAFRRMMRRPSPALVVATIALLVALGGTASATAPFLSSGSPAGGSLVGTYPDPTIGRGTVGSEQVIDHSLGSDDIAIAKGVVTADLPSIQPGECNGPGRGIAGLESTDFVLVQPDTQVQGLFVSGWVDTSSSVSVVVINVCNFTGAAIAPPTNTYRFIVIR